jgi:hypothetical protein
MLEQGLVNLLISDVGVSALIGDRLYPVQGPPDNPVYSYVTYQDVAGSSSKTMDGAEWDSRRIQFDIWGASYGACKAVAIALRNVLSSFAGTLSDGTRVLSVSRVNYIDHFDSDSRSYRSIAEYQINFVEI